MATPDETNPVQSGEAGGAGKVAAMARTVKPPRLWRYIVTEVGGFEDREPPVAVGEILIDRWKGQDADWRIFDFKAGKVIGWFCGVKVDEYDGPRDAEGWPVSYPECGHTCCAEPRDPNHDHFLKPDECPRCQAAAPSAGVTRRGAGRSDQ